MSPKPTGASTARNTTGARPFPNTRRPSPWTSPKKEHGPGEELWVAEDTETGRLLGCIMLCDAGDNVGQLRLFLVEPDCRRFGIGSALTRALFDRARQAGYRRLILWTAGPLEDAVRIYGRMGFVTTETSENTDWSLAGEPVTEVKMELEL